MKSSMGTVIPKNPVAEATKWGEIVILAVPMKTQMMPVLKLNLTWMEKPV